MLIRQEKFGGSLPKVAPNQLPSNMAKIAQNCDLQSGNLRPLRSLNAVWEPTKDGEIKSIYFYNNIWLHWITNVHVIKSPLAADTGDRLYFTGDGVPKFTDSQMAIDGEGTDYPLKSLPLSIPVPGAPTIEALTQRTATFKSTVWSGLSQDDVPSAFEFTAETGVKKEIPVVSDEVVISGINAPADISVSAGGSYSINGGSFVSLAGKIYNGDRLKIKHTSSDQASTEVETTVTIGGVSAIFSSTTSAGTADGSPDAFGEVKTGQPLDETIQFTTFKVVGMDADLTVIDIADGEYSVSIDNGVTWGEWRSTASTVYYGNLVRVRVDSAAANSVTTEAELTIGATVGTFSVTTVALGAETTAPDAIALEDKTNVQPLTLISADEFTVSGVTAPVTVNIVNGSYSINGGEPTELQGVVADGDIIKVFQTTGGEYNEEVETKIILNVVGGELTEQVDRFWLTTFARTINGITEEGSPGDPSETVTLFNGQDVEIDLTNCQPEEDDDSGVTHIRIYAALDGSLFRIGEVEIGVLSFTDNALDEDVVTNPVLPSEDWLSVPDDLRNLILLPNGAAAGISGKQVCLSVPYQLHAWPTGSKYAFQEEPTAIGAFGSSIVVLLPGNRPQLLTGPDPEAMAQDYFELKQTCQSASSVAVLGGSVCYSSPDGVSAVGQSLVDLVSQNLIDRADWQDLSPSSILGVVHDNRYYGFWKNGQNLGGFIIDPRNELAPWQTTDIHATAAWPDEETDTLYLVVDGQIVAWNTGEDSLEYLWQAKDYILPKKVNMACCKVDAVDYDDITLNVLADGVIVHTERVENDDIFVLPDGYQSRRYGLSVSGTSEIEVIVMAETFEEVQRT